MDSIITEVDDTGVERALLGLADVAQPFVNAASKETAEAIATEMRARLARALGPNATGQTVAAIHVRPAYDSNGWIIIVERDPMPNLPFWIEKGTKAGEPRSHTAAARPFFYPSIALEINAHQRRLEAALQQAANVSGLGGS